jgi:hypothetical protein
MTGKEGSPSTVLSAGSKGSETATSAKQHRSKEAKDSKELSPVPSIAAAATTEMDQTQDGKESKTAVMSVSDSALLPENKTKQPLSAVAPTATSSKSSTSINSRLSRGRESKVESKGNESSPACTVLRNKDSSPVPTNLNSAGTTSTRRNRSTRLSESETATADGREASPAVTSSSSSGALTSSSATRQQRNTKDSKSEASTAERKESSPSVSSSSSGTSVSNKRQRDGKQDIADTPPLSPLSTLRKKLDQEAGSDLERESSGVTEQEGKSCTLKDGESSQGALPERRPRDQKQIRYLEAMVRQRKKLATWQSSSAPAPKKPRQNLPTRYEWIRVEPVKEDSSLDHRRTRSSDFKEEQVTRTIHKRVTADELMASPHTSEARKWSVSRGMAPCAIRKKKLNPKFPFTFQRAATPKTQTK